MAHVINQYRLRVFSSIPLEANRPVADIQLMEQNPGMPMRARGRIDFFYDGTPLDPPTTDEFSGFHTLRLHLSLLQPILQSLREESPALLDHGLFATGIEKVGEEEGSAG